MKYLQKFFLALMLFLMIALSTAAQNSELKHANLEISGETVETVRGGEIFFYKFTITNNSLNTAEDVRLRQEFSSNANSWLINNIKLISISVSQGTYKTNILKKHREFDKYLIISFGDIQGYGSVSVTVEARLPDWGDVSNPNVSNNFGNNQFDNINRRVFLANSNISEEEKERIKKEIEELESERKEGSQKLKIGFPDSLCSNCLTKKSKFSKHLTLRAFPSKNIPPRIELISPKQDIAIIKPLNKQIEVPISVKAFDIDGKIEKVIVDDQSDLGFSYVVEDNQMKISFRGKTYTQKEFEDAYEDEEFVKSLEVRALETSKDTYTFIDKTVHYGENRILFTVVDNQGRSNSIVATYIVKRDAEIKIISPKNNEVIMSNTDIIIETESEIKDSDSDVLKFFSEGDGDEYNTDEAKRTFSPILEKVSKVGNIYKHRYVWKPKNQGRFNIRVFAVDNKPFPILSSDFVNVFVVEPRVIKIIGIKNRQEFGIGEPINIAIHALDAKGNLPNDEYEILIDGKYYDLIQNSWQREQVEPYKKLVLDNEKTRSILYQSPGLHTIQVVAKPDSFSNAPIIGKSEIITFKIKEPK